MNQNCRRGLSFDVGAHAGGRRVMETGEQLTEFEGAKIVEVFKDETETDILQFNETCGSSNLCTSAYCVKLGGQIDETDVQGISGLPQHIMQFGPIDFGEYLYDVVQGVFGIGIFGGYSVARLQGILAV